MHINPTHLSTQTQNKKHNSPKNKQMVSKDLPKELLERVASLKIRIENYYEQLNKQVNERSHR